MNTIQRITKLAYESIDDTYSHAEYGDFKVIMNIKYTQQILMLLN